MTHHASQRATARAFEYRSPDIYWRKAPMYALALSALANDAQDNYQHAPARSNLIDTLRADALDVGDLMIEFRTTNPFKDDAAANALIPFVISPSFPYSARHYAAIVADMRDYAIASLKEPTDENIYAFGALPSLLSNLEQNLMALMPLERGDNVRLLMWPERPTRIPLAHRYHLYSSRSTPHVTR